MTRKRIGGFIFVTYKVDHPPLHVHISNDRGRIGRWDIENQVPLDNFQVTRRLKNALARGGYLREEANDDES